MQTKLDRRKYMIAILASAKGATYGPVQIQKLFFLLDKNIDHLVDGPHFDFQPYHYGPFDQEVYQELEKLATDNVVEITIDKKWKNYRLTLHGQNLGEQILSPFSEAAKDYIKKVADFVLTASFVQLVSAIYKAYPEMRANSVFQE